MTLWLMSGAPGSGKSTWAKNRTEQCGGMWISRDEIRFSKLKDGEDYFSHEDEVIDTFIEMIQLCIDNKVHDIYADASHLTEKARERILSKLRLNDYKIGAVILHTTLGTCFKRNDTRTGHANVPHVVIKNMDKSRTDPATDSRKYDWIIDVFEDNHYTIRKYIDHGYEVQYGTDISDF